MVSRILGKQNFFAWTFFACASVYCLVILPTPMFGDDFQRGVVNNRLLDYGSAETRVLRLGNLSITRSDLEPVLSLDTPDGIYPLFFQSRETGLAYLPLRILSAFFDPLNAVRVYCFSLYLLSLWATMGLIKALGYRNPLFFFLYGMAPVTLFSYGPYYADAVLGILALLLARILVEGKGKNSLDKAGLADALIFIGLGTRIVFLWHVVFLAFIFPGYRKLYARSALFFLFWIMFAAFLGGSENFQKEFFTELWVLKGWENTVEFGLKALQILIAENFYLSYFTRWNFSWPLTVFIWAFACFKAYLLFSFPLKARVIGAFAAYLLCAYFLTYHFSSPADYLVPLYLPSLLACFSALKKNKSKAALITFGAGQLLCSLIFILKYSTHGPPAAIDAAFNSRASEIILKNQKTVYVNDRFFWGQPDFFTGSKLRSVYVDPGTVFDRPVVELCGYGWGEPSLRNQPQEQCGGEVSKGKKARTLSHPRRDATIIYSKHEIQRN